MIGIITAVVFVVLLFTGVIIYKCCKHNENYKIQNTKKIQQVKEAKDVGENLQMEAKRSKTIVVNEGFTDEM